MSDADAPLRPAPEARSVPELLAFGVVNLDKPPGPSAHQVAAWARDLAADALGAGGGAADDAPATVDRAAHAGTLDPKVTGCLPLLLGDATRLAQALDDAVKKYVAVLELHRPAPADTDATVAEFEGPLLQKPPRKSAVSRRLRTRTVHELDLLEREDRRALLRIECEAGTYVRKLCHDLGLALGTGGNMGALRRTGTGSFDDTTLRTMHDYVDALAVWREDGHEGPLRAVVQPAERVLTHLPRVTVAPSAARAVATGAPVYAPGVLGVEPPREGMDEGADPQPGTGEDAPLVAGYVPSGAAVCLGRLVGDPDAERGTVVDLERVLV
ncbi:RNA-guided pseudouridylation complex pseudouridine synthase subunit Cbf5 [Haloglomus irregulare]|uniref:Probable tRNA pseudouridine synthase B n=1 Tax=Haloglomus irregulare TaxID=2234134 RepID=A0A554NF36_9EURY|nr:RNA-guided pseudouridylation complex pseudouridine synthase subunit Cbf5 [Haloglomus irregulare]TSD16004.1 RNA-guided pseudouridylation complex pseudouridine synthase subunit Cbf5 [Haloglomus irregulare]